MRRSLRLGALDLSKVYEGMEPADGLWCTLELVPRLESFGYSRYWIAEHHSSDVAQSSPEVLLPMLAGLTERMRIGVAGVLLNLASPFRVASQFRLLHTVFPGRIDLGLARAGAPDVIERLLLQGAPETPYPQKVDELLGFLRGTEKTPPNPMGIAPPEVWLLGKGTTSMRQAAARGAAFCLSLFIGRSDPNAPEILREYRRDFEPSAELDSPHSAVAFAGVCADTDREAKRTAAAYGAAITPLIVGTPDRFRAAAEALSQTYETRDLIFLDLSTSLEARIESYGLAAEALGLDGSRGPAAPAETG